jgi:hypothetical protein
MPDFVNKALEGMGPSGAFISVLVTFIMGLATAVAIQWRHSNKVYGYRLAERDTLNKALTDSTAAINSMTKTADDLNEVTEELAAAITAQASASARLGDRQQMQHEVLKDEVQRQGMVISASAEATRVNSGILTDIRNFLQQSPRRPR